MKHLIIIIVSLISLIPIKALSQFINNGSHISLSSGVALDIKGMNFTNQTNTYNGDITSAGKIYVERNWTNNASGGQLFDSFASAGEVVFNGTTAQTISGLATHFYNFSVANSSLVEVSAGNLVKVYNNFSNDGSFTLKTNTTKTAMLIDAGDPAKLTGSGNFKMERFIAQSGWHYISSPIIATDNSTNFLWGAALYDYSESTHNWSAKLANQQLEVMKGYDAYFKNGDKTAVFTGKFNTGDITINVTKVNDGYNFIGNPYPCPVNWDAASGWTKTNIDNAIYIWDPSLNSGQGDYMEYVNGTGNRGGTRFIPATQSFWVKCNNALGGSVTIKNGAKCNNSTVYFRESEEQDIISIKAFQAPFDNETTISFNNNASNKFDKKYDALKIFHSNPSIPQIYTVSSDENDLAINSLSDYQSQAITIPLNLKAGTDGKCSLKFDFSKMNPSRHAYLEDKQENKFIDLLSSGVYEFNAQIADNPGRFLIHFTYNYQLNPNNATDIVSNDENTNNFFVYEHDGKLYVKMSDESQTFKLRIFDMAGKVIENRNVSGSGIIPISKSLNQGIYLVEITNTTQQFTTKIVVD